MITVVFATHNGAGTLPLMLESLARLEEPNGGWALIAVDNASTDETPAILEPWKERLPLQVLHQPKRGKNAALNLAVPHFQGDLVVFTDDDVVPQADWLVHLQKAAAEHPDFALFGGKIEPIWPSTPPDWFVRVIPLGSTFAITPDDLLEGPVSPGLVWGANMAVRKSVFDAGLCFDEAVGPQAGQYRMGSETEFVTRLSRLGYKSWHCSASRVGHIIRPHQMDPYWIIRRANRFGRGAYWMERDHIPPGTPLLFGAPRWKVRRLLEQAATCILAKITSDFERGFAAQWQMQYILGYLSEAQRAQQPTVKATSGRGFRAGA